METLCALAFAYQCVLILRRTQFAGIAMRAPV